MVMHFLDVVPKKVRIRIRIRIHFIWRRLSRHPRTVQANILTLVKTANHGKDMTSVNSMRGGGVGGVNPRCNESVDQDFSA